MAKNKYATEYPAILKEKAKAAGIKVKKADYRFLDNFMLIQEEAEHPDVKLDLLEESEEIVLKFTTYQRAVIHMKRATHDASEIGFHSNAIRIPASLVDTVGKQILAGEFINNYLALQLTIEPVNDDFADIVMDGLLWLNCHKKTAPGECAFYLICFIEQINQIYHELSDETCKVRLVDYGDRKVSVIKLVCRITGLGLKKSKELVETAPDAMIVASSRRYARWLCKELLEIGAHAEIA